MARNTEERHAELRQTLIDLAEAQIQTSGVESLRARDLAKAAGCSVGAIYNVFQDMTGLVMAANVRTFERLGATVEQSLRDAPDDPTQQLIIMSQTYLAFAEGNRAAWRALFDLAITHDTEPPEWYAHAIAALLGLIEQPVRKIFPDEDEEQVGLLTRTLFSAVNGIVLLGIEEAVAGVPKDRVSEMIARLLKMATQKI